MKKKKSVLRAIIILSIIGYAGLFTFSFYQNQTKDELLIHDVVVYFQHT